MDDLATLALLAASAFFVVLAVGLLFRYRQVSQRISASSDLGRDLWEALETRLRKQDERILDLLGRVEVIQSRATQKSAEGTKASMGVLNLPPVVGATEGEETGSLATPKSTESQDITSRPSVNSPAYRDDLRQALDSKLGRQDARIMEVMGRLEAIQSFLASERATTFTRSKIPVATRETVSSGESKQRLIIEMLGEKARTSVEIRQRFNVSREHAARLLKDLFDRGLVIRNDSSKPFVYELTDEGRRYLSAT